MSRFIFLSRDSEIYLYNKKKQMKNTQETPGSEMRPFPGPPIGMGLIVPIKLNESAKMLERGSDRSKKLSRILDGIVQTMAHPESYFNLYQDMGEIYPKMREFWNTEIYQKMKAVASEGVISTGDLSKGNVEIDVEGILAGIDPEGFHTMQALIMFLSNARKHADNETEMSVESCEIFHPMLWSIYISIFKDEYLDSVLKLVDDKLDQIKISNN